MKTELDERMALALGPQGGRRERLSWTQVAQRIGRDVKTIKRWRSGETTPSPSDLNAFARETGVMYHWLATGEGPMVFTGIEDDLVDVDVVTFDPTLNPSRVAESPAVYRDAPVMIAVYDVEAAAGEGFINDAEHVVAQVPFEKSELVKRGIAAKDVAALYVSGNSMRGSIDPGEIIFFVRQDDNRIVSDSVYIFRMGDAALVKRLEIRAPGKVTAKSDNADIAPFEINLKDQWLDFHIIGRVFASIKWH